MCIICVESSSFHFSCPKTSETNSSILPENVEAGENSYGKTSLDTDASAEQITRGNYKWDDGVGGNILGESATVTYGYSATYDSGNIALNLAMMAVVEKSILAIEEVANIEFSRIGSGTSGSGAFTDAAEIDIEAISGYGGGYASWGYSYGGAGNPYEVTNATVAIGATAGYNEDQDYGTSVTLHEIAHAIGLSHPGDYNGSGATTYEQQAEYFEDSAQYSVMSYWSEAKTGANFYAYAFTGSSYEYVGGSSTNFMLHDIAALHRLYGANMDTRTQDTVYGFNSNTNDTTWTLDSAADSIIAAVWDAGGNDTLDLSGFYENANVDLRQEAFSSFGGLKWNFSIAKGVDFENATGGYGDDIILGNDLNNYLTGNAGADSISGGNGADWLYGDADGDMLNGNAGADLMFGGTGIDTMNGGADGDYMWGGSEDDIMHGNDGVDWLRGEDGADMLYGDAGNDVLLGGAGNDMMWGGTGTDTFYGEADNDTINGGANGDVAFGQAGNDILNGGSEGDFLFGGSGMDTINGGTQNDLMWGDAPGIDDGVQDIFNFDADWGFDAVYDFELGIDEINFSSIAGLTQFSDLTVYDGGANVTVAFGADAITLYDVTLTELNANQADFVFS